SSRRRHTRSKRDWSSDVCSSDREVEASDGLEVSVDELGAYVVTATDETQGGQVTFAAGDATTSVPVTVGTQVTDVVDFGDLDARSDERRVGKEGPDRGTAGEQAG